MSTRNPTIAATLTAERVAAGFNQAQLAAASGVSKATISRIEAGLRTNIGSATIEKLADALGVLPGKLHAVPTPRRVKVQRKAA